MQDFTKICKPIAENFVLSGEFVSAEPFGEGHINRTFLIKTSTNVYILQQINTNVFPNVDALMRNIKLVTTHLSEKGAETLRVLPTKSGALYQTVDGACYRMYDFIGNTVAYQSAPDPEIFCDAGRAFGAFANALADFDASQLAEVIPHFHDTPRRFAAFEEALAKDACRRADTCREEIAFFLAGKDSFARVTEGLADGSIPLRVTHNDTKINNILMDAVTHRARAVIDLDTVMPGSLLYDFGDAIRSGAATAAEDERDLSLVHFDLSRFTTFARGYVGALKASLTPREIELLPYSAYLLTAECGMRFLTDYLAGDTYFHTDYAEHNLVRARTQIRLASEMQAQESAMAEVIRDILK